MKSCRCRCRLQEQFPYLFRVRPEVQGLHPEAGNHLHRGHAPGTRHAGVRRPGDTLELCRVKQETVELAACPEVRPYVSEGDSAGALPAAGQRLLHQAGSAQRTLARIRNAIANAKNEVLEIDRKSDG